MRIDMFFYLFAFLSLAPKKRTKCLEDSNESFWVEWMNGFNCPKLHDSFGENKSVNFLWSILFEWFYEDLQDLLGLTPKKRCPFHYRRLECKSRKSRNTWSNRQIWPWSTEWAGEQRLIEFCQGNALVSKHPLPTPQEKTLHMDITRWSTLKSDWLYSLQPKTAKLYTVSKNNTASWLWLRSWTPYCQIQT